MRHAMPAANPDQPPALWPLSDAGSSAASALCRALPDGSLRVASNEKKAVETIGAISSDDRFDEVGRDEPFGGDFRGRRRAYLSGSGPAGWEPRSEVATRFDAGIRHWRAIAGDRVLVVATHGMAMTLWLAATVGLDDPAGFWAGLRFPDLLSVDLERRTVSHRQRSGYQAAGW